MDKNKFEPLNPLEVPRFGGIATFSRLPYTPISELKKNEVDVCVWGIPFDGGTTFRPGARFAPRSLREASVLCRNYHPLLSVNVYENLRVTDVGDASINPLNLEKTHQMIEAQMNKLHSLGARIITLGGDHSVLLPILAANHKNFGELTLIQFDAHTDTADQAWGEKLHHGTPIRRAIEKRYLKGSRVFQIGIRGPLTSETQEDFVEKHKINVLDIDRFYQEKEKAAFFEKLRKTAGSGPVYISFDVDGVDPAFTPGTGTPVVGGMTSYEALDCLRKFRGLNVIGGDIVEVSPPYDHAQITSLFGAAVAFEYLSLMAIKTTVKTGAKK